MHPADPIADLDPGRLSAVAARTFIVSTTIGSAIWNSTLIGDGYLSRWSWHDVEPVQARFQDAVVSVIAVAVG